jgi:hypothetical protein
MDNEWLLAQASCNAAGTRMEAKGSPLLEAAAKYQGIWDEDGLVRATDI